MADDDLELLQQLLDMSEDEDCDDAFIGGKTQGACVRGPSDQAIPRRDPRLAGASPNKRLRLTETASPPVAGKSATECRQEFLRMAGL